MEEREEKTPVMDADERMEFLTRVIRGDEKTADKLKAVDLLNKLQADARSGGEYKLEELL